MTTFQEAVYQVVRSIEEGSHMTYKDVAHAVGRPGASRAVGSALKKNYDPTIPCHRVIRSDGHVGQYNRGGATKKLEILKREGAIL
jgi:O-6-methylguanine DNA methyltransferase